MRAHKPKECERIKEILSSNPKGLTIEEISQILPLNRNSTAKYLNTLHISGQVEMREFGRAKVFSLTQRMPLSQMLSLTRDLILILDRDAFIVHANTSLIEFFGISGADLIGHHISFTSLAGEFPESFSDQIVKVLEGVEQSLEVRFQRNDTEYFFHLRLVPIVFDSGSSGVFICFEDITELHNYQMYLEHLVEERTEKLHQNQKKLRRKIEELTLVTSKLEISEEHFRLLAENARDIVYRVLTGVPPVYDYVSPAASLITGYSADEFLRDPRLLFSLVHPDDQDLLTSILTGGAFSRERRIRWRHKDGHIIWIGEKNTPILDEKGHIIAIEGIARDISDRVRAEEELRRLSEYNRGLIETTPDLMITIDSTGRIADTNRAMEVAVGARREVIIGSELSHWFTTPIRVREACQTALEKGEVRNIQLELQCGKTPPVPVLLTAVRYQAGEGPGICASVRDIREITECEDALQKSEAGYRALVEALPSGVMITDLSWSVLLVNRRLVSLTGAADPQALNGREIWSIIPEPVLPGELMARVKNGEQVRLSHVPLKTLNGGRFIADVTVTLVHDTAQKPFAIMFLLDESGNHPCSPTHQTSRQTLPPPLNAPRVVVDMAVPRYSSEAWSGSHDPRQKL